MPLTHGNVENTFAVDGEVAQPAVSLVCAFDDDFGQEELAFHHLVLRVLEVRSETGARSRGLGRNKTRLINFTYETLRSNQHVLVLLGLRRIERS